MGLKLFDFLKIFTACIVIFILFFLAPAVCFSADVAPEMPEGASKLVAWTLAIFFLLNRISWFLSWMSEQTKNTWDNKIALWMSKIMELISKVIDMLTSNDKPK